MKPVLHFPRFGKTLLAAALVAMAGTASADQSLLGKLGSIFGASSETKATASKGIEGDIDAAKALTFLYGNVQTTNPGTKTITMPYGKELDCTEWAQQPLSAAYFDRFNYASIITAEDMRKKAEACKILAEKYTDEGVEKYMLVTVSQHLTDNKTIPEIIVASTFVRKDGQWALESSNDFTVELFEIGVGPLVVPGRADDGKPEALVMTNTDYKPCMAHNVYAIVPLGGAARLLPLFSPGSNGDESTTLMTCNESCLNDVGFDTASQGDFSDIVVSYGNCDTGKKLGSQRWSFQNGKYVKLKAAGGKKKGGTKKRK